MADEQTQSEAITVDDIRGWLAEDEAAPNPSILQQGADPPTEPQQAQVDPRLKALDEAKVTTAGDLATVLQYAEIGRGFESKLRSEAHRLMVAAFGTDYQAFKSSVDSASIEGLRGYIKQAEHVLKAKGLVNSDNENQPTPRTTTPSGPDPAAALQGQVPVQANNQPVVDEQVEEVRSSLRNDLVKNFA